MKWLIVVLFNTIHGDIYIFTDPNFESREACMEAVLTKKETILGKILAEYGTVPPIRGVNCLQEKTIDEIFERFEEEIKT